MSHNGAGTRRITANDGVSLAIQEHGDRAAPTVLAVHGYPDDHTVWDGVVAELSERFHVVTYDVRGAGGSTAPTSRAGYHLDRLAADLGAVADEVSPDRPVHLLAHDWGSIQAWHAVTGPGPRARYASLTSISGPSLDYAGAWFRSRLRRPTARGLRELLVQLASSGYIGFFQLPALPELAWRSGLLPALMTRLSRGDTGLRRPSTQDGIRGLELYRANMLTRLTRPEPVPTGIPAQVLAPRHDPFVSAPLQSDVARWVPELTVRSVAGGHWVPRAHPKVIARCVTELAEQCEGGPSRPALRRAHSRATGIGRPSRPHQGSLAVITGAGSGIGRATALALAERGADVVIADRDEPAAEQTCREASRHDVTATAYQVDVADPDAMAKFADRVITEHGVPDIVINNAGIGMAGPFTETSLADWQRIIDVNLWGVIHGCRLFATPMIERGEGGQIVNLASAAAYLPSRALPAYSTTKAAVLMLSECLRAELAEHDIGVSAICPGIVHTNITTTTRFVGADTDEETRRQQASHLAYGRRNYTPERAAKEILRALERNRALAPVTPEAHLALAASRLTPAVLRAAARREVKF
ncbi:SDR family oxidoreductase [Pseudonocardia eucalypti]|uniref:SDR family oxidoreductase n=1 Tax=Pseudonocardia eucalypti TaxID=648755 RepID=A0ABP9QFE5_9PSEU|nr:NAD(P)-dependent dehydrogenase (short-subunit alcohol dehydrogenase family)/pimeloyl-ACP methyl ester carboxylesterase [Pseudonocardia eucalypti]